MNEKSRFIRAAAPVLIALSIASGGALAQGASWKLQCHSVGGSSPEPLGDREGHSVQTSQYSCRTEDGPLDGAVLTGVNVWEYDKATAKGVSGHGVYRMPGTRAVYQHDEQKLTLVMTDGKVSGFTATGRGTYKLATGSAAALAGKPYTYSARGTGPGQFAVDVKAE